MSNEGPIRPAGRRSEISQLPKQDTVEHLAESIFRPTVAQKKLKHLFWERWDGVVEPSAKLVTSITGVTSVGKWMSTPGFKDWLMNESSTASRLSYLVERSFDVAEEILDDPDAQASAKVATIKVILAYKHALDTKNEQVKSFDGLNREQLLKVIKDKVKEIGPEIIEIEGNDSEQT